jgi:anti-sigma B factor antagonist
MNLFLKLMEYDISEKDNVLIISPRGRMDTYSTIEIEKKINHSILKNNRSDIVLNFKDVEYISSIGLRVIYSTIQVLEEFSRRLKICNLNALNRTIFENLNILDMFDLYENEEEAVLSCEQGF